jgi:hypothetical protein
MGHSRKMTSTSTPPVEITIIPWPVRVTLVERTRARF